MGLTIWAKNRIMSNMVGRSYSVFDGNIYLGLSTEAPTESGTYTEPSTSGTGYARQLIGYYGSSSTYKMSSPVNGVSYNDQAILFPRCTTQEGWGEIKYVLFFNAQTGGNLIGYSALAVPKDVPYDYIANFDVGAITLSIRDEDDTPANQGE